MKNYHPVPIKTRENLNKKFNNFNTIFFSPSIQEQNPKTILGKLNNFNCNNLFFVTQILESFKIGKMPNLIVTGKFIYLQTKFNIFLSKKNFLVTGKFIS